MNRNQIITDGWSNDDSKLLYELKWPDEPKVCEQYEEGKQCGGCSFFAPFNYDWGLCCHATSRHRLETVFEHFTCPAYVEEGWEGHSFGLAAIYEILDRRSSSGHTDTAERHNEHQP